MCRLIFYKLKHSLLSTKILSIIMILSITASLFCINVMLGYAEDLYRASYDASWYSTICITNINYDEFAAVDTYIEKHHNYDIGSSLMFSKKEDITVIGWAGSDPPTRWFPEMAGRFFNEDELIQSQNIAYVSKNLFERNTQEPYIVLDNVDYEIIGYGWIIGSNFEQGIGTSSTQTVIDGSDRNHLYMIIPHMTFEDHEYAPEMILVHINEITYDQLDALVKDLQNEFSNIEFVQSDNNSNTLRTSEKLRYVPCGIIFALLICISLVQMFDIWFAETKQIVYAYTVCGVSRKKMFSIMLLEILFFVVIGMVLALISQWLLLPFLSYLGVSSMPDISDVMVTLITAFIVLMLLMNKYMSKNLKVDRSAKQ